MIKELLLLLLPPPLQHAEPASGIVLCEYIL